MIVLDGRGHWFETHRNDFKIVDRDIKHQHKKSFHAYQNVLRKLFQDLLMIVFVKVQGNYITHANHWLPQHVTGTNL